jgi:hypothetical protein
MTVPYNATMIGIGDKLAVNFDKKFITFEEAYELLKNNFINLNILEKLEQNAINKIIKTEKKKQKKAKALKLKIKNNVKTNKNSVNITKEKIESNLKNKGLYIYIPKKEILKFE